MCDEIAACAEMSPALAMSIRNLDYCFNAKSIAVTGAWETDAKVNAHVLDLYTYLSASPRSSD